MQKSVKNIKLLLGEQSVAVAQKWLEWAQGIDNANRVFQRIASAKDKEQLADSFAEIRYALIFSGLGFHTEFEPTGNRGPDLGIQRNGAKTVVEIMRFRKINDGLTFLNIDDDNLILPEYGNISRDIRKAFNKILAKFRQIGNQKGIIAIWNDDEELEEIETREAVYDIRNDVNKELLSIPEDLLFVLYGSKWIGKQQLYCFPFQNLEQPFSAWKMELEQDVVSKHIERAFLRAKKPLE